MSRKLIEKIFFVKIKVMKVFLNNRFVNIKEAKISALDRGFLYGEGAFETLRSLNRKILFIKEHYKRLKKTLKLFNIKFNLTAQEVQKILKKLLKLNNLTDAYIRITVSAGLPQTHNRQLHTQGRSSPTVFIFARELNCLPKKFYKEGVPITISKYRRNIYSVLPFYKTLSYLENIIEKRTALRRNFFDTLFLDNSGKYITECATSNIFIVQKGVIYTPATKITPILPGITRQIVIRLARKNKIKITEKKITKKELLTADEVFITNSLIGILPVKKICNEIVGNGSVGKLTKLLIERYHQLIDFYN
ncbi:MAG: aminotransferase class IV [Elusimicrobiota bacterium]|nr:aminotransferase class IV [Elusimicrobiota bacterium]